MGDAAAAMAALDAILDKVKSATASGLDQGAMVLVDQAQGNAPVKTGTLARSIFADPVVERSENTWVTQVAPHVVYGRIRELGGVIVPHRATALSWVSGGRRHFARSVLVRPRPYLSTAVDESAERFSSVMSDAWAAALGG